MKIEIDITDDLIQAIKTDIDASKTAISLYYDNVLDSEVSQDFNDSIVRLVESLEILIKFHEHILTLVEEKK